MKEKFLPEADERNQMQGKADNSHGQNQDGSDRHRQHGFSTCNADL